MSTGRDAEHASRHRWAPRAAVVLGRLLSRLPPRRLSATLTVLRRGARPATYEQASRARAAVVRSSPTCSANGCLPRSIATALLCRVEGAWPTWRVGVVTGPFAAHAWVEAEDRIVDEPPGVESFRVLMTVPPEPVGPGGSDPMADRRRGHGSA
ncbi:Transglutaminase-like superfamily protein [Geodermatophilus siccatus]|uniref:Transglutaminase-like superfamily protein n=1 Tax=Geodermatophilus siccatus TaxID=1137991 RepID=A0A1G9NB50_9ACTN|nr:Transglutaminase-like superfamily protein [Geodermatophilus siccatus]